MQQKKSASLLIQQDCGITSLIRASSLLCEQKGRVIHYTGLIPTSLPGLNLEFDHSGHFPKVRTGPATENTLTALIGLEIDFFSRP